MLSFRLHDESVYKLEDDDWVKALAHYLHSDGIELEKDFPVVEQSLAWLVEQHWQRKTRPTKFDHDEYWEDEYSTPTELAHDVMYEMIRPALMGIILSRASDGELYVMNINEDGSHTKYDSEGAFLSEVPSKDEV